LGKFWLNGRRVEWFWRRAKHGAFFLPFTFYFLNVITKIHIWHRKGFMQTKSELSKALKGEITIPSDKSISHRAVMFASLAKGISTIENFSQGADCLSTLEVCKNLGIKAEFKDEKTLIIDSTNGFTVPKSDLYCGNSGTTMRLMSGILAGQNFNSVLTGDESLSKRPMKRVIEPLTLMGAEIEGKQETVNGKRILTAPLKIHGTLLHSIDYVSELASAQVKSCVLLAGLHAEGKTSFAEPYVSRNHTERMLEYLGAKIRYEETGNRKQETAEINNELPLRGVNQNDLCSCNTFNNYPSLAEGSKSLISGEGTDDTLPNQKVLNVPFEERKIPKSNSVYRLPFTVYHKTTIERSQLQAKTITVAGDISSAAFFIVAGLIVPNSEIVLKNVGLNPTRTGIIDVVQKMGADIELLDKKLVSNEEVGDIRVKYSHLKGCTIEGEIIPRLIDELPVIAVLATQAEGTTIIKDAEDLRNKESDRIKAIVTELKKLGANIEETPDGFIVHGKSNLKGGVEVETYHDHRLAMSLYVAGMVSQNPILINGFEWVNISFPKFEGLMNNLN
jgi:3-phosphoshikimate 1-carboxyvinyltransferase